MKCKIIKVLILASLAALIFAGCESTKVEKPVTTETPVKVEDTNFNKEEFISNVKQLCRENKNKEALKKFDEVPSSYKNDYELNLLKLKLLDVCSEYRDALDLCSKLLQKKSKDEELNKIYFSLRKKIFMNELQAALENGNYDSALKLYDSIDEDLGKDFNLRVIKASLLVSAEKYDEARNECEELLKIDSNSMDVKEIKLAIAQKTGNTKERTAQLQAILKADPYNAPANIEYAQNASLNKNYKQAKMYYAKALKSEPRNETALFGYGQMEYYLENDEKSEEIFNRLLSINPKNEMAYAYLGKLAYAHDDYKIASDYFLKAIEINPKNYDFYCNSGLAFRGYGKFKEAEEAWTKAIELDPTYFLAYAYRAGIRDEQDKFKEALEDYNKVLECNPKYYYAYENIGILALHEKDYRTAGSAFYECRKNNQTNISYPILVTYCYYMLGNKKAAKDYSNGILRKMGNINSIEYKMLRAFHDENGYKNLEQQIANLKDINLRGKMYFYLGLLYDMFGIHESAKEMYAKVISVNSQMFFEYRIAEWEMQAK